MSVPYASSAICGDTSDDETLFAVAPWQGIPQLLLKSLNLAGSASADAVFRVQKNVMQNISLAPLVAPRFNGAMLCVNTEDGETDSRGRERIMQR